MDLSKLPDSQRHELEQLQKQFYEHQHKQQPQPYDPIHPHHHHHQPYDPSHAYDQPYYPNYHQHPPHPYPQQPPPPHSQHQYDGSYYQNYYSNSYQQHPITPAYNDRQRNEESGSGPLGLGQFHDPYGNQVNLGYPGPPGAATAAAVAALSQLTQFSGGHYDQGHFRPPVGHPTYSGGGRRGGHFRGGGRGNSGLRPPNAGASGPPFHGRGRGRGRGRDRGRGRRGRHGALSSHSESSADANAQPTVRTAWCEVCKIDCTTNEVLDEHNKGKRHKRNLRKLQDRKGAQQPVVQTEKDPKSGSDVGPGLDVAPGTDVHPGSEVGPGTEVGPGPDAGPGSDVGPGTEVGPGPDIGPGVEKTVPESEPEKQTEIADDNNKVETVENKDQEKKPRMKRKMKGRIRGTRGGGSAKRMRPTGPRYRKVVIPLVCDLCNIKCDTQEVFDRHSAGKKHMAKLKKFEGHQAMYGPTAVQALYPPNPLSQTLAPPPAYYGPSSSYPAPPESYVPPPYQPQNPNPAPPESYIPPPYQPENPNPQLADAPLEFATQNAVLTG